VGAVCLTMHDHETMIVSTRPATPPSPTAARPILVTGAHRSGTTWVGRVLALARRTAYLDEPFSPVSRSCLATIGADRWFTYLPDRPPLTSSLDRLLTLDFPVGRNVLAARSLADARLLALAARRKVGSRGPARWIVKDPIALFSSEYLEERFEFVPIVLIRHPAAFASSILRLGWRHPFGDFLEQAQLMSDHLAPFVSEMRSACEHQPDPLDEAILLWRSIYSFVAKLRQRRPDWIYLRHEDISRDPVPVFVELYGRLGLEFTPRVERKIVRLSTSPIGIERGAHDIRRDSRATIDVWRNRLTRDQVEQVRLGTLDVAPLFYADSDW
jgi:hypothetical protein